MSNRWMRRVLGEDAGEDGTTPPSGSEAGAIPQAAEPLDALHDERNSVEDMPSSAVVNTLVQAWKSGSRNDVAAQLLFTPVSYADFVRMCFQIGQADAVQLGDLLDNLADESGIVTDVPGQNKILSRVTGEEQTSGEQVTSDAADVQPVPPGDTPS